MKNVKEEAEKLARPFADELGLEIVEVEYARKHNGMNLTFFIDKEHGKRQNQLSHDGLWRQSGS